MTMLPDREEPLSVEAHKRMGQRGVHEPFFPKRVAFSAAATFSGSQNVVGLDSTDAAFTLTLSASLLRRGFFAYFKDEGANAGTNNITIDGNGVNIDGASTYVLNTNSECIGIYSDATKYFIFVGYLE